MTNQVHKIGDKWAIGEGEPVFDTKEKAEAAYLKWKNTKDSSIRRRLMGNKPLSPNATFKE